MSLSCRNIYPNVTTNSNGNTSSRSDISYTMATSNVRDYWADNQGALTTVHRATVP